MKDVIESRFQGLLSSGTQLVQSLPRAEYGSIEYYVESRCVPQYQEWLSGVQGLLGMVCPNTSPYLKQLADVLAHEHMKVGVVSLVVQQTFGILSAAHTDWKDGLLRRIEFIVAAQTFDDFLDHATQYHKAGKKTEASVLGSAVLEDTIKKIAIKNGVDSRGQSLEQLIDVLVVAEIFTLVKAKRIKSWSGVRNDALHAEWDNFDIRDVGTMIEGLRELVSDYL